MMSYKEFVDYMYSGYALCFSATQYIIRDGILVVRQHFGDDWGTMGWTKSLPSLKTLYECYVEQDPACWLAMYHGECDYLSKRYT